MRKIIPVAVIAAMAVCGAAAYAQQPAPMTSGPAQIFTALPAGTTVTNFYKQTVYDQSGRAANQLMVAACQEKGAGNRTSTRHRKA
jgi:hypothetical protein